MKKEFVLNCPGSIQTLSKEEFLEAADERATERAQFIAMTTSEPDEDDEDDDEDDGGELVNNAEQREIAMMLGLDNKS